MTWEEFLTTKFGLWIDTHSSTENTLHSSGRAVEKSDILLQIEKAAETSGGDLTCYVFSFEDTVAYISVNENSEILTTENNKIRSTKMESYMSKNFWICRKLKNCLLV